MRCPSSSGYTLAELLVVVGLVASVAAVSAPMLVQVADRAEAAAAARHISALVARARFEAARRSRVVALRFAPGDPRAATFVLVADGDGDGVGDADVAAGVDVAIAPPDRLSDHFGDARFAVASDIAGIDGGAMIAAGSDPIRLGSSRQISISPVGTASGGTIYIASRRGAQYAVRLAGVTGRVRVLRYLPGGAQWLPL